VSEDILEGITRRTVLQLLREDLRLFTDVVRGRVAAHREWCAAVYSASRRANIRFVALRLEIVDVVGIDDPPSPSRQVEQDLALREVHGRAFLSHPSRP
jgi:hypothetical protein